MNRDDIAKRRAEIAAELIALNNAEKQLDSLTPEQELAIALHDTLCHMEHTERCGWFYEIKDGGHNWTSWTHNHYLGKARKAIALSGGLSIQETIALIKAVR